MKKPTWHMPSWKKLSWKRVALVSVGILILVYLGRSLLGGFGNGAGDITGQGGKQTPSPKPEKTAEINGQGVPINQGPVAVLNPGLAGPGGKVGVNATGFDPGAAIQVLLSAGPSSQPAIVATAKADKAGSLNVQFPVPDDPAQSAPTRVVTVQQANSDKVAKADLVAQAGAGTVKLSRNVGAPGSTIGLDADGFMPGEQVKVYFGRASGVPAATLKADSAGRISKVSVKIGVAPQGDSTLVMMGDKSKTTATASFTMLGLYPTAKTSPFAVKAGDAIGISAKGFAPAERVLVHFNQSSGAVPLILQADQGGSVTGEAFKVPFGLKGQHTLILTGEQSRASVSSGFMVLPYNPTAMANTYGGLPGTVLNFYARNFAPNEVVKVYAGGTANSQGDLVSAFRVDAKGSASAAGSYVIPGSAQGKLTFSLVGSKSDSTATSKFTVDKTDGPVNVTPQPKYTLPPDLQHD
jgi:hypothetical protein